jgi:putative copper resistance protein D
VSAPLVLVRAIHFAAALLLTGVFTFRLFVGDPAFRNADAARAGVDESTFIGALTRVAWVALVLTLLSGALWLVLQASIMSGRPLSVVLDSNIVPTVMLRTQAGRDWLVRSGLLILLGITLARMPQRRPSSSRGPVVIALALAAGSVAALVWAGHGGAATGTRGMVEAAADAVHLLAAGAWLGGLVPLALLLAAARRAGDELWLAVAQNGAIRFSTLGLLSIASLLATGIVNSWFLVGDLGGLLSTEYGQCLLLKLGLFVVTVGVAGVNRIRLVPRFVSAPEVRFERAWKVMRQLQRNTLIEVSLGLLILCIVGALGTLPPSAHRHLHLGYQRVVDQTHASSLRPARNSDHSS